MTLLTLFKYSKMTSRNSSPLLIYVSSELKYRGKKNINGNILQRAYDAVHNVLNNCCHNQITVYNNSFLSTFLILLKGMDEKKDRIKLVQVQDKISFYLNNQQCC